MNRSPMKPRTSPLRRKRARIKPRNAKRHAREVERANGPVERREWIKTLPCIAAGKHVCEGRVEGAHVTTGGISRKADACFVVPACRKLHRVMMHSVGMKTTGERLGIDWFDEAAEIERQWRELQGDV